VYEREYDLFRTLYIYGAKPNDKMLVANEKANAAISKLANNKKIHYMGIGKEFLENDGTLSPKIMPDSAHPNARGYGPRPPKAKW